jgi:hypothetical protein
MQALSALLFLYRDVLRRPLGNLRGLVRASGPRRAQLWLHTLGKQREDVRVDAVGLHKLPCRWREVAHLARIHYDDRQSGRGKRGHTQQLIPTRRFQYDERRRHRAESRGQVAHTRFIIPHAPPLIGRPCRNHQLVLGYIDPDPHCAPVSWVASPVLA